MQYWQSEWKTNVLQLIDSHLVVVHRFIINVLWNRPHFDPKRSQKRKDYGCVSLADHVL